MLRRTVYASNLRPADSYTVVCDGNKRMFPASEKRAIGKWVMEIWDNSLIPAPAYIYANIDWDCDNILLFKYELV